MSATSAPLSDTKLAHSSTRPECELPVYSGTLDLGHHLRNALVLASDVGWAAFETALRRRLQREMRKALAIAAMNALGEDEAIEVARARLFANAGAPMPPGVDPREDARWWASIAAPSELLAYCVAAFQAMSPSLRRKFVRLMTDEDS